MQHETGMNHAYAHELEQGNAREHGVAFSFGGGYGQHEPLLGGGRRDGGKKGDDNPITPQNCLLALLTIALIILGICFGIQKPAEFKDNKFIKLDKDNNKYELTNDFDTKILQEISKKAEAEDVKDIKEMRTNIEKLESHKKKFDEAKIEKLGETMKILEDVKKDDHIVLKTDLEAKKFATQKDLEEKLGKLT